MATRLINNLGEGGPSSCVISVGSCAIRVIKNAYLVLQTDTSKM